MCLECLFGKYTKRREIEESKKYCDKWVSYEDPYTSKKQDSSKSLLEYLRDLERRLRPKAFFNPRFLRVLQQKFRDVDQVSEAYEIALKAQDFESAELEVRDREEALDRALEYTQRAESQAGLRQRLSPDALDTLTKRAKEKENLAAANLARSCVLPR